jgi:exosortase E/protease (VPEID-CTERM system)
METIGTVAATASVAPHSETPPDRLQTVSSWSGPNPPATLILKAAPRWTLLLLLFGAELFVLTTRPDLYSDLQTAPVFVLRGLFYPLRPAFISGALATLFLSWPVVREELFRALAESDSPRLKWLPWLIAHLILAGALFCVDREIAPFASLAQAITWLWLRRLISLPVYATWAFAAVPPRFWSRWLVRSRNALLAGVGFGLAANILGSLTQRLYWPLQHLTFQIVALLLRLSGHQVVGHQEQLIIGVPAFSVQIWRQCSGLEGIGLISTFLAGYLWFFRRELRFPQAFLLLPLGAIVSWLLNSVRITALILIGAWSPETALRGFHSILGWILFNLVAFGLVWASWKFKIFSKVNQTGEHLSANPAGVYLVPFLALIGGTTITRAFSFGFDFMYPVRVVAVIAALWVYRHELARMEWRPSLAAAGLGMLAFVFWTVVAERNSAFDITSRTAFNSLPSFGAGWIAFRLLGSIITVPIAEELAFRGYLIRKMVNPDIFSTAAGRFTWISFLGSSVLFGLLHEQWLVGTIAGMIFAWAFYRRRLVCDAVMAHATTNALLSLYVLATGAWSLWT